MPGGRPLRPYDRWGADPIGRRRRRLYWTVGLLVIGGLVGSLAGYAIYRGSRAPEYRPGEELSEITSRLALGIPEDAPRAEFVDVTHDAGLSEFSSFDGARSSQLPEDMGSGAAWGDFDRDGDDDLFVVSNGGPLAAPLASRARSRLYRNTGQGRFVEDESFPETRILGMAASWGDYDGDDDPDLVVTGYDALLLFRNDDGRLIRDEAIEDRPGFWAGASWADFDRDGDLDLYVCGYVRYVEDPQGESHPTQQYGRAVPYTLNPASFEPQRNLFFRNDAGGGFVEIAEQLGVHNPAGRSLNALWRDLDGNGWPDLYVANDISDNVLFLNEGGRFQDSSHPSWVADYRGAMGLAAGDWNRDGDEDLFVTHWIAQENALYDSQAADFARRGQADGLRFMDVADQRGLGQIALQLIGWGTEFFDLDSDGWLDLAVANGSTFETADEPRELRAQPSFLFWNRRGESFHDLAPQIAAIGRPRVSRGLAVSDYDLDGDVDLLIVDRDGGVRLMRNDTPQENRIAVRIRNAPGAPLQMTRVEIRLPSHVARRTIGTVSYLSQSTQIAHFGLGSAAGAESIDVHWPDGETSRFAGIRTNALNELVRGEDRARVGVRWDVAGSSRRQLEEFWRVQRAAMDAMKVDGDCETAITLFGRALELSPDHGDSLYYLGNCLAETGDAEGAMAQLERLMRSDPQSHRAHKRWGTIRATTAKSPAQLAQAVATLERAAEINPEETGVSLVLGEVHLLAGDRVAAKQRLEWVVRSNPQSGEAYYVLGYVAWRDGDREGARLRLEQALTTRSAEPKPAGTVAEGETLRRMHTESSPFESFFERWDGTLDPELAFAGLRDLLAG